MKYYVNYGRFDYSITRERYYSLRRRKDARVKVLVSNDEITGYILYL